MVGRDGEECDRILWARGEHNHDSVVGSEAVMEAGGGKNETGDEGTQRGMGQCRAGRVGGPDSGGVGRRKTIKECGDATRVGDRGGEMVTKGNVGERVREVGEECQRDRHGVAEVGRPGGARGTCKDTIRRGGSFYHERRQTGLVQNNAVSSAH